MQENYKPRVEIIDAIEKFEESPLNNDGTCTMVDPLGRTIVLEEPDALDYYDYLNLVEVKNGAPMLGMFDGLILVCIKSIDGIDFKKPKTVSEIRAAIKRLGKKRVIDEVARKIKDFKLLSFEDEKEDKEELKK